MQTLLTELIKLANFYIYKAIDCSLYNKWHLEVILRS